MVFLLIKETLPFMLNLFAPGMVKSMGESSASKRQLAVMQVEHNIRMEEREQAALESMCQSVEMLAQAIRSIELVLDAMQRRLEGIENQSAETTKRLEVLVDRQGRSGRPARPKTSPPDGSQ